jgi:hypothetical protein
MPDMEVISVIKGAQNYGNNPQEGMTVDSLINKAKT